MPTILQKAGGWSVLLLLLLCVACRHENTASPPPPEPPSPSDLPAPTISPEAQAEPPPAAPTGAETLGIYLSRAYRPAGLRSQEVQFEATEFRRRLSTGVAVTVIPLGIDLPPVQSRVLGAEKTPDPCSDALPPWWEIQLAPLTQPEYVGAVSAAPANEDPERYPFQVCVLYPANPQARALNPGALDVATLPAGTRLEQVVLALDLDADQAPDVVLIQACCDKPELPLKNCDLTCRKTWLRTGGQWKVIDAGTPC